MGKGMSRKCTLCLPRECAWKIAPGNIVGKIRDNAFQVTLETFCRIMNIPRNDKETALGKCLFKTNIEKIEILFGNKEK